MPVYSITASTYESGYHTPQRGFSCSKVTTSLAATTAVGLLILTQLPTAEAVGLGAITFPLCMSTCITMLGVGTGGVAAITSWATCKAICVAAALAL